MRWHSNQLIAQKHGGRRIEYVCERTDGSAEAFLGIHDETRIPVRKAPAQQNVWIERGGRARDLPPHSPNLPLLRSASATDLAQAGRVLRAEASFVFTLLKEHQVWHNQSAYIDDWLHLSLHQTGLDVEKRRSQGSSWIVTVVPAIALEGEDCRWLAVLDGQSFLTALSRLEDLRSEVSSGIDSVSLHEHLRGVIPQIRKYRSAGSAWPVLSREDTLESLTSYREDSGPLGWIRTAVPPRDTAGFVEEVQRLDLALRDD